MICDDCLKATRDKCEKDISLKPKKECWIAYLEKIKTEIQEMGNDNPSYYYTCDIFEREKLLNLLDEYIEELKGE